MAPSDWENIPEREFLWPKLDDNLFLEPTAPMEGGMLASSAWERLVHMADGYHEAADILVNEAEERRRFRASLVYPIIFMYRHSIELKLKYVLITYGRYAEQEPDWTTHKLDVLWPKARRVIENLCDDDGSDENADGMNAVEEYVMEFARIDPGSFSFRYPITNRGEPMELTFDSVNLAHLKLTMKRIGNFFLGVDGYLDDATRT